MTKTGRPSSALKEAIAYETLLSLRGVTESRLERDFPTSEALSPTLTDALENKRQAGHSREIDQLYPEIKQYLGQREDLNLCTPADRHYPDRLKDASLPLKLFYYRGNLGLLDQPCVSVIGSRQASPTGLQNAEDIAEALTKNRYVVVSGLARGIDTAALEAAISRGGQVIAVIGTPIDQYYPPENRDLQDKIARQHLLISQVPFCLYLRQSPLARRGWFPKRDVTMSALSQATVVVEAVNKSGALYQARAAIKQKRQLFIHRKCFEQHDWPQRFESRGAIKIEGPDDIIAKLKTKSETKRKNKNDKARLAATRR